jgi:hypothetical protein
VLKRIAVILLLLLPTAAHAETRLALIVTNASYPNEIGKLANPHKHGDLIAAALKTVGFATGNITVIRDADQTTMRLLTGDDRSGHQGQRTATMIIWLGFMWHTDTDTCQVTPWQPPTDPPCRTSVQIFTSEASCSEWAQVFNHPDRWLRTKCERYAWTVYGERREWHTYK